MRKTPNSQQLPINIVGSSNFGVNPKINGEKTYNMFISDGWLINMPGWRRILDIFPAGQGRGSFVSTRGEFAIIVINSVVMRLDMVLGITTIGTLGTTRGPVFIDENLASQICIVDGQNAYIYNYSLAPNLTVQPAVSNVFTPNYVVYHNTFFLFGNADRNANGALWYAYEFDNATLIKAVPNQALAIQTKPDYAAAVVRIPSQANNVLVIGTTVSEVWTQIGGAQNYIRNSSFNIDYGCVSVDTIAFSDKFVVFLGTNSSNTPSIIVFTGQSAEPISTGGIDNQLRKIKHPGDSVAEMYQQNGHLFYQLTFYNEEDNLTLIYDFKEKRFYHGSDQNLNYHPAASIFYFNGATFFLSLNNGSLYQMSPDLHNVNEQTPSNEFPEDPRLIFEPQRIRICEPIRMADSSPFRLNELVFTLRMGNDDILVNDCEIWMITEQGIRIFSENNLQVIPENGRPDDCYDEYYRGRVDLSLSRDGGENYSNTVARYMKPLAHRQNIIRWESLGSGNDVVPKFRFWSLGSITANNGYVSMVS